MQDCVDPASPDASLDASQRSVWIAVLLFTALGACPFFETPWSFLPVLVAASTTFYARRRHATIFHFGVAVSILLLLLALPLGWAIWPTPLLVTLLVYVALNRSPMLDTLPLPPRGRYTRTSIILTLVFVLLSSGALLGWWFIFEPDLSDASSKIPDLPLAALASLGLVFAVVNAIGEEFIWRGLGTRALEGQRLSPTLVVLIQAISFGFVHIHGFPRGWVGVGLATIYGGMMGILRQTSGGLMVPWIAHIIADLVIFGVLAFLAQQ